MQVHAQHVAQELAQTDEAVVYTLPAHGLRDAPFEQHTVHGDDYLGDARRLADEDVDAWLCLEATYASVARRFRAPVFVYFHGRDFVNPRLIRERWWLDRLHSMPYCWRYYTPIHSWLGRNQIRRGLPGVAKIFTNSTNCARLINEIYGRSAEVVPPGVDEVFFQAKAARTADVIRLLTVSRLTSKYSRKNIDGVLHALSLLPQDVQVYYNVVGDGPDRGRLEDLARELGLQEKVQFLGGVSQEQLLACYREADLFVLASKAEKYDVEGFGMVYIEASAAGTPALCSRAGGAVDAVEDGVSGLLIPDSSPQAIADGIIRFVNSRGLFPEDQVRAFAEKFRWPRLVGQIRAAVANYSSQSR